MIFDKATAHRIVAGKKTQLRAPVRRSREFGIDAPCSYTPGERYPVQAISIEEPDIDPALPRVWLEAPYDSRDADAVIAEIEERAAAKPRRSYVTKGYVLVTAVRRELLHEITPVDVLAMGFRDRRDLWAMWRAKYGTGPLMQVPVWVVEFERTESPDVYLQARVGAPHGDYTTNPAQAIRDGGSVIVDEETAERLAALGRRRHSEHRQQTLEERRRTMTLDQRLRDVREAARARGVDVSSPLKIIEKQVEKMERAAAGQAA